MDLINSIGHIENRLGERKPALGKGRVAQKNHRNNVAADDENPPDTHAHTDNDTHLGRKVDTTA